MRFFSVGAQLLLLVSIAGTQITRIATFENFTEGQAFAQSFSDPLSGITFRDSTHPGGGFSIEYSSVRFGGGNYLTAGGYVPGPGDLLGVSFGFTADLPAPASQVWLDVLYRIEPREQVVLEGFDAIGQLVAMAHGPTGDSVEPLSMTIQSAEYVIVSFRVSVGGGDAGYDNISYTIVPEPTLLPLGVATLARRRAARHLNSIGAK